MNAVKAITETRTETVEIQLTGADILDLLKRGRKRLFRGNPTVRVFFGEDAPDVATDIDITADYPVIVRLTRSVTRERKP